MSIQLDWEVNRKRFVKVSPSLYSYLPPEIKSHIIYSAGQMYLDMGDAVVEPWVEETKYAKDYGGDNRAMQIFLAHGVDSEDKGLSTSMSKHLGDSGNINVNVPMWALILLAALWTVPPVFRAYAARQRT
jgi:hypothetical protein